jgi:hypothetical protein
MEGGKKEGGREGRREAGPTERSYVTEACPQKVLR